MRSLLAAVVLVPALASAQPGTVPANPIVQPSLSTSPEVLGLVRGAHVAGARGDCVGARALAARIQRLDPDFYAAVVSTDLSITACKPKPRVYAVDPETPAVLKATGPRRATGPYPDDTGRNVGGQVFLGTVMGAGLGFLGVLLGAAREDDDVIIAMGTLGLVSGTTMGVVLAGDNAGSDYSLGLTLAGSVAGSLLGWKVALEDQWNEPTGPILILILAPTVGAMLGFNASRRTLGQPASPRYALPTAPRISDATSSMPVFSGSF